MSDNALPTFRHSGKFTSWGPWLPIVAALVAGFPLGHLYATLIRWIPLIYVNVFLVIGYGLAFGWATGRLLKFGRVRNVPISGAVGVVVGLIALYWDWNGHIHALFSDSPWFLTPDQIWSAVRILNKEGSWSLHDENITGIALAIVWVVEAAIIIGFSAIPAWNRIKDTPYSENDACWLDEEKHIRTLAFITDPGQLAALRRGDLLPVIEASPRHPGVLDHVRLTLKRSPNCAGFCTLRAENIRGTIDKNGKVSEKIKDLTGDLILDSAMFDVIAQLEQIAPEPAAENPAT